MMDNRTITPVMAYDAYGNINKLNIIFDVKSISCPNCDGKGSFTPYGKEHKLVCSMCRGDKIVTEESYSIEQPHTKITF